MKFSRTLVILALALATCHAATLQQRRPDALKKDVVDQENAASEDLEDAEDDRTKRSGDGYGGGYGGGHGGGGGGVLGYVGNKLSSGISSGISSIAHASSGLKSAKSNLVSGAVASKTGGGHYAGGHDYDHHEGKSLDGLWSFKTSIVQTLLQAVKALTGGVIGISGKVTKGAGYAVEAKGRFLQSAGDKIYGYGKTVSQTALHPLIVHHHPHPHVHAHPHAHGTVHHEHTHYEPAPVPIINDYGHGGYGASSIQAAPLVAQYTQYDHQGPDPLDEGYGAPHYQIARAAKPSPAAHTKNDNGVKAGLLVLKPIAKSNYGARNNLHHASSENYNSYAPPPAQSSRTFVMHPQTNYNPALVYDYTGDYDV